MTEVGNVPFRVIRKIGQGSFGKIFIVEDPKTKRFYAMKLESFNLTVPQILFEGRMYHIMSGSVNVPRLYAQGTSEKGNYIVIDLLGRSLESLLNHCHRRMSLKTVLMLADQMISAIQYFHSKNYIHRDIKPENFVMGTRNRSNQVFLIDYGLAKRYRDQITGVHFPYREHLSLSGTARYASIPALSGIEQSRRDDMEGLGYVLIYLLKGELPWQGINCFDKRMKHEKICQAKKKVSISELCSGLPREFQVYLRDVRSLSYYDEPNYESYRELFRNLFISKGYVYDYIYDWTPTGRKSSVSASASYSVSSRSSNDSRAANSSVPSDIVINRNPNNIIGYYPNIPKNELSSHHHHHSHHRHHHHSHSKNLSHKTHVTYKTHQTHYTHATHGTKGTFPNKKSTADSFDPPPPVEYPIQQENAVRHYQMYSHQFYQQQQQVSRFAVNMSDPKVVAEMKKKEKQRQHQIAQQQWEIAQQKWLSEQEDRKRILEEERNKKKEEIEEKKRQEENQEKKRGEHRHHHHSHHHHRDMKLKRSADDLYVRRRMKYEEDLKEKARIAREKEQKRKEREIKKNTSIFRQISDNHWNQRNIREQYESPKKIHSPVRLTQSKPVFRKDHYKNRHGHHHHQHHKRRYSYSDYSDYTDVKSYSYSYSNDLSPKRSKTPAKQKYTFEEPKPLRSRFAADPNEKKHHKKH